MLIGKDWKVESDDMNVTIFKRKIINGKGRGRPSTKAIGSEYFIPVAYLSNVHIALEYIINKEIQGTGLKDFETVVKKVDELIEMIKSLKIQEVK